MTKLGTVTIVSALLGAVALVALPSGGLLSEATAAKNPAKASARCRKMIGKSTVKVVIQGLKAIERCHKQRLKRDSGGDCNSLQGDTFQRAKTQALARLNLACKEGDPVAANYGTPIVSAGFERVLDAIEVTLEESGTALSASPVFQGDAQTVKALKKCHGAVGKGRTSVVQGVVKGATKCQQRVDKSAQSFGPLDPSCLVGAGGTAGKASGKISKSCGSFSGVEVGSCAALPGCLVAAGEASGQRIARLAYGGPAVCGNGLVDLVEECDDGNAVEDDGCTSTCKLPVCGDGSVNDESEECDDTGRDDSSQNCFECKLNVCGDGNRDTEEPGLEECDDGNTVGGDGCTNCTVDPTMCSATGVGMTISLEYPEGLLGGVSATRLEVSYPAYVSIPGSLFASSVRQRVTSLLPDDFSFQGSDRDANGDSVDDFVRVDASSTLGSIDPGDVAQVQFDCAAAGTPVFPQDFPCTIPELVDPSGNPFPAELASQARCVLTFQGAGPVVTTTTTTTTPPTTSGPTTTVTVSTTTTTRPATCGNGGDVETGEECDDGNDDPNDGCTNFCTLCGNDNVTAPESCDDGNNLLDDNCPEDCRIEACVPSANPVQTITVTASRADLSSIRFLLDYPDGRVALGGGAGPDVPPGTIFDTPDGTDVTVFDLEHAVRILVGAPFAFETATIARLEMLGCTGSNPPAAGDYRCIVIDAADGEFNNVSGVTCSVSVN